ncbi:MAG: DUF4920 domain-containing protein [Deltaproteobacteria bacterium]|nr:DUF4920 domain-containing protein [Deltaproteobacteria bacterium]
MKHCTTTLIIILAAALALPLGCCKEECDKDHEHKAEAVKDKPEADKKPEAEAPKKAEAAKLGMALAGAAEVSVADLLSDPKAFDGKTVKVSGKVEDFCHHKRAWFGVTAKEGKGMVRIFTKPRFEVPLDCKGKNAVAEGKVEVITIDPEQASHYSKDHKFLAGVTIVEGQPILRPIIRAFGAELK